MKLACLLMFAAALPAQVHVQFVPESRETLKALHIKSLDVWNVMACNDGAPRIVPPERIKMLAPGVAWVITDRVEATLVEAQKSTLPAVGAEIVEIGIDLGGILGGSGAIAMSKRILGQLALGSIVAHYVAGKLQGKIPSLAPYTNSLLQQPVSLTTGQCGTWTLFAGRAKKAAPITAILP